MDGNTFKLELNLPEPRQASLSFCEATPRAIKEWVAALPMANVGETSRRLYHAVIELNQLICPAAHRIQLLELLRPPVHFVCGELGRHFLGHSIALPEKQRKVANLAQALQLHLAGGYKLALAEAIMPGQFEKHRKLAGTLLHRCITELSHTILRSCQLYCPSPASAWLECHRMYRFALVHQLENQLVADEQNKHKTETSVADAYKRLLLLGCAKPNQLRQHELVQVFDAFESWAQYTDVSETLVTDALFVVNTARDAGPLYRTLVHDSLSAQHFGFDTAELAHRLTEYLAHLHHKSRDGQHLLDLPDALGENLLAHLSQSLGILTKRTFKRISSSGKLQVCVGMSATHYFCAHETEFSQFLAEVNDEAEEGNIFMSHSRRAKDDTWANSFDAGTSNDFLGSADAPINFRSRSGSVVTETKTVQFASHTVSLVNTSPGGYCINWDDDIPSNLQAGEILGVREASQHPWSIAVIRWIRQIKQHGTQVGVELLAPSARPVGVRLIQKVGNSSEFLRGLLLPELSSIGQPATLITPRLPFQTGNRVTLFQEGRDAQGVLNRRVSATGSVSQFELKLLDQAEDKPRSGNEPGARNKLPGDDEFDSLWPTL